MVVHKHNNRLVVHKQSIWTRTPQEGYTLSREQKRFDAFLEGRKYGHTSKQYVTASNIRRTEHAITQVLDLYKKNGIIPHSVHVDLASFYPVVIVILLSAKDSIDFSYIPLYRPMDRILRRYETKTFFIKVMVFHGTKNFDVTRLTEDYEFHHREYPTSGWDQ